MTEHHARETAGETVEGAADATAGPPCLPPIEIRKDGSSWLLAPYEPDASGADVLGTHSTRIEAMREAKNLMDDQKYPCMVLWSSPGEMQDAYWNPLYEQLELRFDPMMEAWVIVPADGHYCFASDADKALARGKGREIQLEYDFKHLVVYREDGKKQQRASHHFISSM